MELATPAVWAAQDALKAALVAASGTVAVDLGFPETVEPKHIWINGEATSSLAYDECGNEPSGEELQLTVHAIATFAGTYAEARAVAQTMWGYITTAIQSAGFRATVSHARVTDYKVEEARTESDRQIGLTIHLACSVWE